jgi:CHRD domain-containing protein
MKKSLLLVLLVLAFSISTVAWDDDVIALTADLRGANEVPAINSNATASFKAAIHEDGSITFTETFQNLTSNAIFSHIHFGKDHVAGGVMIFLCGGGGQPACPAATSGTFSGSITPANVTGPTAQGVTPGDLVSALRAIRQGAGYVNLHSVNFPGGEVRGQVIVHHGDDDRNDR